MNPETLEFLQACGTLLVLAAIFFAICWVLK
jgi:hypothetical protein